MTSTIAEVLSGHATRDAAAPAIVSTGLEVLSFGDLDRHVRRIGTALRDAGVGAASRVGIALPRSPEAALLNVGICANATVVPFNPTLPPAELRAELERVRPDALIVPAGATLPEWANGQGDDFALFRATKAITSFDEIALEPVRPLVSPRPAGQAIAGQVTAQSWTAIFKTSGTTGPSKRVPVTHQNLIEMARKMERWLALTPADRSACIMPIYYNAGFKATLVVPLLIGCSVALPASGGANDMDQWLAELRPTWLTASPAFLQGVAEKLRTSPDTRFLDSLRFVLSTASYLPEPLRAELQQLLARPIVEFYGLCEAGMMTGPLLPPHAAKAGSVGRIPPGELVIRDDAGQPVPAGQVGHVLLSGPSVMPGYLFDDIDGVPSGLVDGWLATGDIGSVDADGHLTVAGRTKEIINRGGEKVAPYDVEKALLGHPAVREAAAFAVPHPRLGENVGAAVVLHPGAAATPTELVDFVYDRLAPFQRPRHVHVVDRFPVGATGKTSRPQLSAAFSQKKETVIPPAAPLEILIAEIWKRVLNRADSGPEIGMDDDFFEIGGDSLQATEMLLAVEKAMRHHIKPSDIRAQLTIRLLSEKLASATAAKREVITKAASGKGTPMFWCHGDFCGWGFYAFRLSEMLKADGPMYLLHSLLDDSKGITTIEQMAARYLAEVQAAAPSGPIRVGGYCHGGLAALELAHLLERAGREVEKVVLIDTFSLNARRLMRPVVRAVLSLGHLMPGEWGRKVRRSGMPSVWVLARHILKRDPTIFRRVAKTASSGSMRAWDSSQRTTYYRAMSNYLPHKLRAEITCLLCEEYSDGKEYDPAVWGHLAPSVQRGNLPGAHNTCVSTHLDVLAERLNQEFGARTATPPALAE